ncbi:tetratricopeptide repeat protein [Rhizobium sp. C4]|uniref:tetratricopeptide repeat-containing glycosyltransferase family protein n=1 Tax=Rhizobium sp. C4 TaxID=1349800 RepID=UPI001E3697C9|nr:tetratricopeptide repeat-containing glycosyltransferase family protein [Rhizobium sp. C4]MCD2174318.1 tetratricopeptide repeat protein [Rhizobium sp. C4]
MTSPTPQTVQDEARALYHLGLKEKAEGRLERAIEFFDAALAAQPDFPEALCSGGYILQTTGHYDGALAFYGRAIELDPGYFDALFNRGCLFFALGQLDPAVADFSRAAAFQPKDAGAYSNLGAALHQSGRLAEAVDALRRALELDPALVEAELNLGSALRRMGREDEAHEAFMRAALLKPDCAEAYCGLGIVARARGEFREAFDYYDCALAFDPTLEEALSSKGSLQLLLGQFEAGWEGYESRWVDGHRPVPVSDARFDLARPETIAGKRVLVVNDHGLGDTIQFFRYVKLLSDHGADVTFAGPAKLQRLLSTCGAKVSWRDTNDFTGTFDARIAISSLPRAFATVEDSIPADVPFLSADPERVAFWRQRMPGSGLKIGLCWRGSQDFRVDPRRSPPPATLAPLAALPGVQFFALHMDVGANELPAAIASRIHVFGDGFDRGPDAFVDTAAVMANLDLVVTCDTSIAHLAGALGLPVWVTLRHIAEWRWMVDRETSPWYPTMRLMRAKAGDDWFELFERIANDIDVLAQEKEKY